LGQSVSFSGKYWLFPFWDGNDRREIRGGKKGKREESTQSTVLNNGTGNLRLTGGKVGIDEKDAMTEHRNPDEKEGKER